MVESIKIGRWRFYKIGGRLLPSVTSILSQIEPESLRKWKQKYSEAQVHQVLEYSSHRGNLVHWHALKQYHTTTIQQNEYPSESLAYMKEHPQMKVELRITGQLFQQFRRQYQLIPVALEKVVWSEKYGYAGRCDFVGGLMDNKNDSKTPILMDIKTSKEIYTNSVSMQLSAYNEAINNRAKKLFVLLLHSGRTQISNVTIGADKSYWSFKEVPQNFDGFKGLLKAFQVLKPLILNEEKVQV